MAMTVSLCVCRKTAENEKSIGMQTFLKVNNCIIDRICYGSAMIKVKISNDVREFQNFKSSTGRDEYL